MNRKIKIKKMPPYCRSPFVDDDEGSELIIFEMLEKTNGKQIHGALLFDEVDKEYFLFVESEDVDGRKVSKNKVFNLSKEPTKEFALSEYIELIKDWV